VDNITDNNKLIAEFMGIEMERMEYCFYEFERELCARYSTTTTWWSYLYTPEQMEYSTSWDWLMPVVEKIYDKEGLDISGLFTEFLNIAPVDIYNIKYVYCSVIEFIKWYNANNKGE